MKRERIGLLLALAGLLPGCATIVEGTGQSVAIATNPPGATCAVDRAGDHLGMVAPTPGSLRLDKSKNDLKVICTKDGYAQASMSQSPKFVGTTFGNLVVGGVAGFIVDAATGANYVYPSEMKLDMIPNPPAPVASVPSDFRPVSAGFVPAPAAPQVPNRL